MEKETKTTLQEILYKLKLKEIATLFGAVASPLIVVYSLNRFIGFDDDTLKLILTSTISLMTILLLLILVYREITSSRKEKYANITEKHHFCFHTIRDLETFLFEIQEKSSMQEEELSREEKKNIFTVSTSGMTKILDNVAAIYSMVTGTRCRATIKTIYEKKVDGKKKLFVRTLARDSNSYEHNYKTDIKRYENDEDCIEENEDFELLYYDEISTENCFFCNDLFERRAYKTSSFKVYGEPPKDSGWFDRMRYKGWRLPYRSAIVWPIQQKTARYFNIQEKGCIGFLAVDSESRGVFKRWDLWVGAAIADALFHPLNNLFRLVGKSKSEVKENAEN